MFSSVAIIIFIEEGGITAMEDVKKELSVVTDLSDEVRRTLDINAAVALISIFYHQGEISEKVFCGVEKDAKIMMSTK